jgi:hypothetical protein
MRLLASMHQSSSLDIALLIPGLIRYHSKDDKRKENRCHVLFRIYTPFQNERNVNNDQ